MNLDEDKKKLLSKTIKDIEHLDSEISELRQQINDLLKAAKAAKLNPSVIKSIIKIRKMTDEKRKEESNLFDLYLSALGMNN